MDEVYWWARGRIGVDHVLMFFFFSLLLFSTLRGTTHETKETKGGGIGGVHVAIRCGVISFLGS